MSILRVLMAGFLLASSAAMADDLVWIGGNGDWDDDASWSTAVEPTIDDAVEISDHDTVQTRCGAGASTEGRSSSSRGRPQ